MENEIVKQIAQKFRVRAKRLRNSAVITLFLILLALGVGMYLFVFSGNIAINELAAVQVKLGDFKIQTVPSATEAATTGEAIKTVEDRINKLEKEVSKTRDQTGSNIYLVSTVTTRIGAILILLFLVQILVSLYRYNIRLAAYYDARADGFELMAVEKLEDIEAVIRILSPENIDFGKQPTSPASHAVELAKEVLSIKGK